MSDNQPSRETIIDRLVKRSGLTLEQTKAFLQAQAELACEYAPVGYPIPGIGVLISINSPERREMMNFGPKKGQMITVPAKQRLKFQVDKNAKETVRGRLAAMPDVFSLDWFPKYEDPNE